MPVEIHCVVREIREKAIAVADGTTKEFVDQRTGEISVREKWFWLPRRAIRDADPEDYDVGDKVTLSIPEKLAEEKELV